MVTNWCVDFLILIYKKEDSALPINYLPAEDWNTKKQIKTKHG